MKKTFAVLGAWLSKTSAGRKKLFRAHVAAGDAAMRTRDWRSAREHYGNALALQDDTAAIWVQYGHAAKEAGNLSDPAGLREAERAYRRALALCPDVADTHLQLGHLMKLQGQPQQAIACYRAALELDPSSKDAAAELQALGVKTVSSDLRDAASSVRSNLCLERIEKYFRHDEYYQSCAAHQRPTGPDRLSCLKHLLARKDLGQITLAYDARPDVEFMRREYADVLGPDATADDCMQLLLSSGQDEVIHPNLFFLIKERYGHKISPSIAAELLDLTHWTGAKSPSVMLTDLIKAPFDMLATISAPSCELLTFLGDLLSIERRAVEAADIYAMVLQREPKAARALRHAADNLYRLGLNDAPVTLYMRAINYECASIWTYFNAADAMLRIKNPKLAIDLLADGCAAHPEDRGIRRRFEHTVEENFWKAWRKAERLAGSGARHEALEWAEKAAGFSKRLSESQCGPARPVERVALVADLLLPQCRLYRVDQKIHHLKTAGYETALFDGHKPLDEFVARIGEFDAVIFYRLPAFPAIASAIAAARRAGVITFYEIDDLIFDTTLYPPPLETYGGLITPAEHAALAIGAPLFDAAMSLCDYGLASTPSLAKVMEPRVCKGQVFVHRNAYGVEHERLARLSDGTATDAPVSILCTSGTKAHKDAFITDVKPALERLLARHGASIRIVLLGHFAEGIHFADHEHLVERMPPCWDFGYYLETISACADINVAALTPSPVTDTKSEIKWLEAAIFGIPSVVSETATYAEVIENGRTGFLCRSSDDFEQAIDRLIREPALRKRIGQAAFEAADSRYGLKASAENIASIMASVSPLPTSKTRLLVVNVFYPPQSIGGATRVVYDSVCALQAQYGASFEIEVFCTIIGAAEAYRLEHHVVDGVQVTAVGTPTHPDIDSRTLDPEMARVFGAFLDQSRPFDLVHFHCIQRLTAAIVLETASRAIPYVITAHDGWWIADEQFLIDDEDKQICYDFTNRLAILQGEMSRKGRDVIALSRALSGARQVICVSEPFAEIYRDAGVPNVTALPNGLTPLQPVPRRPSPDGRVRLAHIGGMARHKGFHLVRHAFENHRFDNLSLIVVDHAMASGDEYDTVWGNTPVRVIPKTPQARIAELYAGVDVLLAPSIWPESYGLVTREALYCGAWVVASDRGAVGADVIEGENGFVIDVGDVSGLVSVLKVIDGDAERFRATPAVRPPLRMLDEHAADLERLYRSIVDPDARVTVTPIHHAGAAG